jgi:hypothetical protein
MSKWSFVRQGLGAAAISALALSGVLVAAGAVKAADLSVTPTQQRVVVAACPPGELVILFDEKGRPTVPARTPYFYCLTGTVLLPADIPPPREYCCG